MSNEPIDLMPFCDTDGQRGDFDLRAPFVRDGHRYATNARICVRVPTTDTELPTDRKVPSRPGDLFREFPATCRFRHLPTPENVSVWCPDCGGAVLARMPVQIGQSRYAGAAIDLIRELPDVAFAKPRGKEGNLYFIAAGGLQGILAALSEGE